MNIGEGAAMLVLEDLDGARRRGATIYAEVAGHSLTCEAFHPTSPEPDGRADRRGDPAGARRRVGRRRRGRSRQRARHRHAAERPRRSARVSAWCSASGRARAAGDVGQVDDRPLPRRRRRNRGRHHGADHRARRHSADASHHAETDPECAGGRRGQRGAGSAGALRASPRRWGSAATTRSSCCGRCSRTVGPA